MNARIVAVDGDPSRAEALATFGGDGRLHLVGLDSPAQRDGLWRLGVERVVVSAAEYDGLLALATRGN